METDEERLQAAQRNGERRDHAHEKPTAGRPCITLAFKLILDTLAEGAVLGEVGFVTQQQRTANVDAVTDGEMLRLNADTVQKNMRLYPHIANKLNMNIARILGMRLASTSNRLSRYEKQEGLT